MKRITKYMMICAACAATAAAHAQHTRQHVTMLNASDVRTQTFEWNRNPQFALKSNLLYGATATPNLGLEWGLGRKTTFDLAAGYNWFDWPDNKKWKHWIAQPAIRFWTCERFNGHFFGLHLHGGEFNVGGVGPFKTIKNNRYDGWFAGGGVSYGHQWVISTRWAFELEIGAGYARLEYRRFGCAECQPKTGDGHYNYWGPTKLGATFQFFLW